ncbi:2-hydroxychromene-2-carboxylate isomerase [Undibacterium sp. TJN19]|uniref:2-hydroxychromene-2-carboxylate isomerase n=1 Tax=Undibacterium sp. TJN19 TaxID=3413055 RepID=UPI003BF19115
MDISISPKPVGDLPVIDFWFEFGSNYSYLSVMRIEQDAARAGVRIRWQPFLLGPLFQSFGWKTSPFILQKEKGEYAWKDMERQCRKYQIPWRKPSNFPRSGILALRVALLGVDVPWMAAYCRRVMQLNFAEDRDFDRRDVLFKVLDDLGLPASDLLDQAVTDDNKQKLRAQTETAFAKGIFGAPTFFVGDEMFWGNDRLDDALLFCQQSVR